MRQLSRPEEYIGIAVEKTEKVCDHWAREMRKLRRELAAA
jgi:hypothetical protein